MNKEEIMAHLIMICLNKVKTEVKELLYSDIIIEDKCIEIIHAINTLQPAIVRSLIAAENAQWKSSDTTSDIIPASTDTEIGKVLVDYYGTPTELSQVASITEVDGITTIQPWERVMSPTLEKVLSNFTDLKIVS